MRDYHFFIYIMASKSRVLYVGMTNDLTVRVYQHKTGRYKGFTQHYRVHSRLIGPASLDSQNCRERRPFRAVRMNMKRSA